MIRRCRPADLIDIFRIINDAAAAYKGVIPADCWHEPYMPMEELKGEINAGVEFWGYETNKKLSGVMGIQDKGDVALIRHAYVETAARNKGIGTALLKHLKKLAVKPILIGTWLDSTWAISFYQKNGYTLLSRSKTDRLLRRYWNISERQIATSIVLADKKWFLG